MDGLLNISFAEYGNVELMLPNIDEQKQLSAFFRSLDNLITLHQREHKILNLGGRKCLAQPQAQTVSLPIMLSG